MLVSSAITTALFVGGMVHADPSHPDAVDQQRAHQLFEQAKPLQDSGKCDEAEKLLLEAWSLQHSPDVAANLGMCQATLGKYVEAARSLRFARRHATVGTSDKQRNGLRRALEAVEKHVASVTVSVTPPQAKVTVDGNAVDQTDLPGPLFLTPGEHSLRATAKGFDPEARSVVLKEGKPQTVTLELRAVPAASSSTPVPHSGFRAAPAAPPTDEGTDRRSSSRPLWPALVGGGLALAGLGAGIGFSLAASSASSDHDAKLAALAGPNPCGAGTPNASACAGINRLDSRAARDRNFVAAGFIVGGVSLVATAAYLLWPRQGGSNGASSSSLHLAGTLRADFATIDVSGSF